MAENPQNGRGGWDEEVPVTFLKTLVKGLRGRFPQLPLPQKLLLYVTHRCNARCIMCNLWKAPPKGEPDGELSIEELEGIFSNPLFAAVKHLDLNGGEPSLRKDTAAIAHLGIKKFPKLKQISMSSNGLLTERLVLLVKKILEAAVPAGIHLSTVLSIHGTGDTLEKMNGVGDAFGKIERTVRELQFLRSTYFSLSANCVLTDVNLLDADRLPDWSRRTGVPIRFAIGEVRERFQNADTASRTLVGTDKKSDLIRFLRGLSDDKKLFNLSAFRYSVLADMIERGAPRSISCHYRQGAAILGSYGDLYYCPHSASIGNCRTRSAYEIYYAKESLEYRMSVLMRDKCLKCPPYSFNRQELRMDFMKYFKFLYLQGRARV